MRTRLLVSFMALLAFSILVAGSLTACGSSPSKPSSGTPASKTASPDGCAAGTTIPQGGGDQDGDNSGGSSDGDGCV